MKGELMVNTALFIGLPLLLMAAGFLLLLPAPLLAAHRQPAAICTLAILLGGTFVGIFWLHASPIDLLVCLFAAMLIAAPLFERARFVGLLLAALSGSAALFTGMGNYLQFNLPSVPPLAMFLLTLVAALAMGLIGGTLLPLHPKRFREDGRMIWHGAPQAMALAGWVCVTLALGGTAWLLEPDSIGLPQLGAALVAAFVTLFHAQSAQGEDVLQKAGEGLAAGLLVTLLAPLSPVAAAALGLAAGFIVARSEALAVALRITDTHHFLGALMFPCLIGLLLPGIQDVTLLAPVLQWLGAALLLALMISLILWPAVMLLFGVALPPRLVREGLRRR
jgi:hypothetical protein